MIRTIFAAFTFLLFAPSCKKCITCQNVCYYCHNSPYQQKQYCSGERYASIDQINGFMDDLNSNGFDCRLTSPTVDEKICFTNKTEENFHKYNATNAMYKCD